MRSPSLRRVSAHQKRRTFSEHHPPASREQAQGRLATLKHEVDEIDEQLARPADPYQTEEAHSDWEARARAARNHRETEIAFLEGWLSNLEPSGRQQNRAKLAELKALVQEKVESARERSTPLYGNEKPPPSVAEARKRREYLVALRHELERFLREFREAAKARNLGKIRGARIHVPILEVIAGLNEELSVLNTYLREHQEVSVAEALLAIIDRARENGGVLTPEDATFVETVRGSLSEEP